MPPTHPNTLKFLHLPRPLPPPPSQVSAAALALFQFGQEQAALRGLLLVDTKYEFGKGADGEIYLIDEVREDGTW